MEIPLRASVIWRHICIHMGGAWAHRLCVPGGIRGRPGGKTWFNLTRQLNQGYLKNFLLQTHILPYKLRPYPKTLVASNYLFLSIHKTDTLLLWDLQRWYGVPAISSLCLQRHHCPTMPFVSNASKLCIPEKPQSLWDKGWWSCEVNVALVPLQLVLHSSVKGHLLLGQEYLGDRDWFKHFKHIRVQVHCFLSK